MNSPAGIGKRAFPHRNLLGISQLNQYEILDLIDRA
jgi:aspartate carbamoyltransferase catalytic subunit